jgi:hypothetical protein
VDQDDLDPAALTMAPDNPAAGPDDRLGHEQPPRSVERARQAVGHRDCAEAVAVKAASAARRPGVTLVPGSQSLLQQPHRRPVHR